MSARASAGEHVRISPGALRERTGRLSTRFSVMTSRSVARAVPSSRGRGSKPCRAK